MLRLPDELRDELRDAAENNGRSVTAEIIARLEASFSVPEDVQESEEVRRVQGMYIQALSSELEAHRKASLVNEHIIFDLASAISNAAKGDMTEFERLVERERAQPILSRLMRVKRLDEK